MSTIACDRQPLPARLWAGLELGAFLLLLEAKLWWLRSTSLRWQDLVLLFAMTMLVAWSVFRRWNQPAPEVHTRRGWLEAGVITALLLPVLFIGGLLLCEPYELFFERLLQRSPGSLITFLVRKTGIVAVQQLLIAYFLWPLCRDFTGNERRAVLLGATIFGLIHLPMLSLVLLTFVAAMLWIPLYVRNGVLLPLIVSHFVLGLLLNETWPHQYTCGMTVGMEAVTRLDDNDILFRQETREQLRVLSSEDYFIVHGGTPRHFIKAAYLDVLKRPAAEREVNYWLARYHLFGSRARIAEWLFLSRPDARRAGT